MRLFHSLVALCLVVLGGTASADIKKNATAGVQVDIPHDWKIQSDGDTLVATDPKEEAAVMFVVSPAENMKAVGEVVDQQLAKIMKDVKWGPQKEATFNGLKGIAMKGNATIANKAVNTYAIIVVVPAKKKGVFLMGFAQADKEAAHKKELDAIASSFAPIK